MIDLVSKRQSKKMAKRAAKMAGMTDLDASREAIPINEQTIDMPVGEGTLESVADAIRTARDLTKSLRAQRRATIKENNFLKTMRM